MRYYLCYNNYVWIGVINVAPTVLRPVWILLNHLSKSPTYMFSVVEFILECNLVVLAIFCFYVVCFVRYLHVSPQAIL